MDPIHQEVASTLVSKGKRKKKTFSESIQEFSEKEILLHSDLYVPGCGPL